MFKELKLNNKIVKPFTTVNQFDDISKIKGGQIIADPYSTIFLCASRKSGKTNVIGKILLECSDKNTVLWIFSPTVAIDDTWKSIMKQLESKNRIVNIFNDIIEDRIDQLDTIIHNLILENDDTPKPKQDENVNKLTKVKFGLDESEKEKKEYKPKKLAPKRIFIFDDLSHSIKSSKSFYKLLKNGRHLKAMVIASFQYSNDLQPSGWKQAQYVIVFKSFSKEKLEALYRHLDLTIPYDVFVQLYEYIVNSGRWDFLYINVKDAKFRKNFNKEIEIDV